MTVSQQIQPTGGDDGDDLTTAGQTQVSAHTEALDGILDDIDAVLETNAAAFVQGFVQKGGQ